jgi:hypothetical protein
VIERDLRPLASVEVTTVPTAFGTVENEKAVVPVLVPAGHGSLPVPGLSDGAQVSTTRLSSSYRGRDQKT